MNRTRTALAFCVSLVFCLGTGQTQTGAHRPFRIGLLSDTAYFSEKPVTHWDDAEQLAGLRRGMEDLGIVEGKQWVLVPKLAKGDHNLLNAYAAELAGMKVDAIAASSTTAAMAARQATQTIPIVAWAAGFSHVLPVGKGSNVTGFQGSDEIGKHLAQLKMIVPDLKRVAVLYDTSYISVPPLVEKTKTAGQAAKLEMSFIEVKENEALAPAFERMAQEQVQALLVLNHPRFHLHPAEVTDLALKYRLPMASPYRETADAGALIAHHPDWQATWRRAAKVIKEILDGIPPGDIPIQAGDMRTFINIGTANALGLEIPDSLRETAQLVGNDSSGLEQHIIEEERRQAEKEVLAIDQQFEDAFKRSDPKREDMLAEDYVGIGVGSTLYSKSTAADLANSHRVRTLDHHVTDQRIRLYGDIAVVTGMRHIQDTFDGKPRDEYHRYTRIWARRNGKWQVVSFQATKVTDDALQTAGFEACSAPDAPVPAGSMEQMILNLEDEHTNATAKEDSAKGTGWLADDYIGINGRGRLYDKQAVTELYRPGSLQSRVQKFSGRRVRVYGDTAILTGTWCFRQVRAGQKELTSANRITRVWVRRNGKWEVVSWQGTPVPPQVVENSGKELY